MSKKFKKFIKRYQYEICIIIISIIALIIGTLAIGFLKAFLIICVIDSLLIIPGLLGKWKVKGKHVKRKNTNKEMKANSSTLRITNETNRTNEKKKKRKKKRLWLKIILLLFLLLIIAGILAFVAFMMYIASSAPKFDPDNMYRTESSILYTSEGKIFAKLGAEKREKISYDQLPEVLVDAIVATEDSRYFQHNGFDLPRFIKASFGQLLGRDAGGASTLTMQVSKNNYTSTTSTGFEGIKRKFTDIYMSIFQIEKKYTKQEILEFYVNQPYLGSGTYGVEQACQTYFGKSAKDINLAEAALIAGLFQAPNAYDPFLYPEASEKRRNTVLYLMERHGYISKKERAAAEKISVKELLTKSSTEKNKYQAFIDTVIEDVEERTGNNPYNVAMEIYTTMDEAKQKHIDDIMNGKTFTWENEAVDAGVVVLDVKTGAIVAVGAGRNRTGERSFNNATMIKRQIGSTAKPLYDYAMGIEKKGWSTYQPFADEPHGYTNSTSIDNWNRTFQGFMTLRESLEQSRNIPALKAFQANSKKDISNFVESVGLSPEYENGILHEAHSLGGYNGESPLSLAAAYSSFASGGYYTKPYTFTKIIYREDDKVFEPDTKRNKVLSEETAYMMNDMLNDAAIWGVRTNITSNGAIFSAKTGTSNFDSKVFESYNYPSNAVNDLWVAGYNPEYSISVWYGYEKLNKNYVSTINTAGHRTLFLAVANGVFSPGSSFKKPAGVSQIEVEKYTYPAKLPSKNTPKDLKITELFKKGTEPTEVSKRFDTLDNVKNLKSSLSGNTVTLTWDKVTPANQDTSWVNKLFSVTEYANKFINELNSYNKKQVGTFGYNVYAKDDSGRLSLIKFVTTNTISFDVRSSDPTTYVVKSSYSILSTCESSGTEVKVNLDTVKAEISASLIGGDTTIAIDESYTESGITVTEDDVDVTDQATLSVTITDSSGTSNTVSSLSEIASNIDTTQANTYTISYQVTYSDFTKTLTRTVTIE